MVQESAKRWASYRLSIAVLNMFQEKPIYKTDKEKSIKKIYQENHIKKTDRIRTAILEFCRVPRSAREISETLNKNSVYLVAKYITPLVKSEKLAYTDPAHPKSRNQKYVAKPQEKHNEF